MKTSATEQQLKRAIEEQLDLILKIQEDRKLLKRQNKSLNQKYLKLTQTLKKYSNVQKSDKAIVTENFQKSQAQQRAIQTSINTFDRSCQVDLIEQQQNTNTLNSTSKLTEAMSFLKAIDTTNIQQNLSRINEEQMGYANSSNILQNQSLRRIQNQTIKETNQDKNKDKNVSISNEIVKMSKQIASLKRQLKQSQAKSKQRQKQLKQVKRCLQTKTQALQKSRKQFNQLSILLNTDKYKSIRNLQTENQKLRMKSQKADEQSGMVQSLKQMLQSITLEYSSYREQKQRKIISLTKELKDKTQIIECLQQKLTHLQSN